MAQDIVDDLYDNLKEDGWVENSREHFRAFFLASGEQGYKNRKALYENMKEDGYVDSPTYEEFARRMGLRAENPAATPQSSRGAGTVPASGSSASASAQSGNRQAQGSLISASQAQASQTTAAGNRATATYASDLTQPTQTAPTQAQTQTQTESMPTQTQERQAELRPQTQTSPLPDFNSPEHPRFKLKDWDTDNLYVKFALDGEEYYVTTKEITENGGWDKWASHFKDVPLKVLMSSPDKKLDEYVGLDEVSDRMQNGWRKSGGILSSEEVAEARGRAEVSTNQNQRILLEQRLRNAERELKALMGRRESQYREKDRKIAEHKKNGNLWEMFLETMGQNQSAGIPGSITRVHPSVSKGGTYSQLDREITEKTAEVAALSQALDDYDARVEAARLDRTGASWLRKLNHAVKSGMKRPNTWTMGVWDASVNKTVRDADAGSRTGRSLVESQAQAQDMLKRAPNPGILYEVGHFGGEVIGDPSTILTFGVGGVAENIAKKTAAKAITKATMKNVEKEVAGRLANSWGKRFLVETSGKGANFAVFEGVMNARQQAIDGGWYDSDGKFHEGFSWTQVAKASGKGAVTGAVMGVFGEGVGQLTDLAVKGTGRAAAIAGGVTGKAVRSASVAGYAKAAERTIGYGVGKLGEGTIFAADEIHEFQTMPDKDFDEQYAQAYGYAGEKDPQKRKEAREQARNSLSWDAWGKSQLTIAFLNIYGAAKHPKAMMKTAYDRVQELRGLDEREHRTFGERLSMMADRTPRGIRITKEEREELKKKGYGNLLDLFVKDDVKAEPDARKKGSQKATDATEEMLPEEYAELVEPEVSGKKREVDGYSEMNRLIDDRNVSEATRVKLYYMLTGKSLPMSAVMGYRTEINTDGSRTVESLNAEGGVVTSKTFGNDKDSDIAESKQYESLLIRQIELNTVDVGERYAEKAVRLVVMDEVKDAVGRKHKLPAQAVENIFMKQFRGEPLSEAEMEIVRDIEEMGTGIGEKYKSILPESMRADVNAKYGVDIDSALKKSRAERTDAERNAVEEYGTNLLTNAERLRAANKIFNEEYASMQEEARDERRRAWRMQMEGKLLENDSPETSASASARSEETGTWGETGTDGETGSSRDFVDRISHVDDGYVRPAVMKDGREVYVVKGIVMPSRDRKSVNLSKSDKVVYVFDPETETVEQTSSEQIRGLGEPVSGAEYRQRIASEDAETSEASETSASASAQSGETGASAETGTSGEAGASVSARFEEGDSFSVGVAGRDGSQHAIVANRDGDTVTLWSPLPISERSEEGQTTKGFMTEISLGELEGLLKLDAEGRPLGYRTGSRSSGDAETSASETSASASALSERTPDTPSAGDTHGAGDTQSAEVRPETANTEAYDQGYDFGLKQAKDLSGEKLNADIEGLRAGFDQLTDFGRGLLEAYEYEQQNRAMAAPGVQDRTQQLAERHSEIEKHLGEKYTFSQEQSNHGEVFYQNEHGSTNLATIPDNIFDKLGIDPIPFKLTETMAWHVYTSHAKELGLRNIDDAIDFVLDIVNNVDHVRLGKGNTYIFSVENGRNGVAHRAITVVVKADTGEFMGIKTSGFDRMSNLEKRPILWEKGADSTPEAVATPTVTTIKAQQGDEHVGRAEGQSVDAFSERKGNDFASDKQGIRGESSDMPEETALQRIPRDKKGKPIFEQAESPEIGWDALVEHHKGDAAKAKVTADIMAENKRKALEKAKKLKPKGNDPDEILASQEAIEAQLRQAEQDYNMWEQMATVEQRRQDAARAQQEAEERQRASERADAEKAERDAREEAERKEREALEGIPEWHHDTPENARRRGVRRFGGQMFPRQEPMTEESSASASAQSEPENASASASALSERNGGASGRLAAGNEIEVKFSQRDLPKGHIAVIEASRLQPSHLQGQRNPMFFIEEAQPKNRAEGVSANSAREIAEGIRPQEITEGTTAYTGAPTVNARGEVIQGNNRSDALRYLWDNRLPEQQEAYRRYLIENAEKFGLDPEAIRAMEKPVLVNMLDVDDAEAIRLGQMTAQDTESGGIERIRPKNVAQALGEDMRSFANLLLTSPDEEATFGQLVDRNGIEVLKWMAQKGVITDTQYMSAFDSRGNLTAEARNDLQKVLYQAVFSGGSQQLEEMFVTLPSKAQRAILSTAFRDMDSPLAGKMLPEIQASVAAFHELMNDPAFANARKFEDVLRAVEGWKRQTALDDRFEQYTPSDNFSNFALHLAAIYKAADKTQSYLAEMFNQMYDLAQGRKEASLFEEGDTTQYPLADIVRKVLNIDYQPAKNGNYNVANGGADVALRSQDGQGGKLRGNEPPAGGEQHPAGTEPSERGAGTSDDIRGVGERRNLQSSEKRSEGETSEIDENGHPFIIAEDGTTIFGRITENTGLTAAPIKLSEGVVDEKGNGYGLLHIENRHGEEIRQAGFKSVEDFVGYVAKNYDPDNIKVGKKRVNGNGTFIIQIEDSHSNLLYVELSQDGSYWNVNSGGIFRKGYADKKKNVEPNTEHPTSDTALSDKSFVQTGSNESSKPIDTHSNNQRLSERKVNDSASEKQGSGAESSDIDGDLGTSASASARSERNGGAPDGDNADGGRAASDAEISDFGERIAGARKDLLRDIAQSVENVSVQSLVELPMGRAFKRPNLRKMVDAGVISDSDASLAEAVLSGIVYAKNKPVATRSARRQKEIQEWAQETYDGIRLLGEILSGDPARRDRALEEHGRRQAEKVAEMNRHIDNLREWNPGKTIPYVTELPDDIEVMSRVLRGIGHRAGEKVDLPLVRVDAGHDGRTFTVSGPGKQGARWFRKYHNTLAEAVETMIFAARLARGDRDVEIPQRHIGMKGVGGAHVRPTGKYEVVYWGRGGKKLEERIFDDKEKADEFAASHKGRVSEQMRAVNEYDAYQAVVTNPMTGNRLPIGREFADRAELQAWMEENRDEVNALAVEAINAELGTKSAPRSHFYVGSAWRKGGMIYSVVENDRRNPWPIVKDFASRKEAEEWFEANRERLESERRQRQETEKAVVYYKTGETRRGRDYRQGRPATPEMYDSEFGFRGVQFGNWTNQEDRQMAMDQAYDALMDLSEQLGLSPRAMSLYGELGLSFGARGGGQASAHYEPVEVVINLTKTRGAGTLAHEWFHALDNYLSRRAGVTLGYATDGNGREMMDSSVDAAVTDLVDAIVASEYGKRSAMKGDYWGRHTEMGARLFETWLSERMKASGGSSPFLASGLDPKAQRLYQTLNYLAYRANELRQAEWEGRTPSVMSEEEFFRTPQSLNGYPYPTPEELAGFAPHVENLFRVLSEKEQAGGMMAEEPGRGYRARRRPTVTGRSLFEWADSEEAARRENTERDEDSIAAVETDKALDRFAEAYNDYLNRVQDMEAQLEAEGADESLRAGMAEQMESEEGLLLDERNRLEESLREFYVRNNTPEDAERIARDMVRRLQAEVEVRHRREHLLRDLLFKAGKDAAPETSETSGTETSASASARPEFKSLRTGGGFISYEAQGHLPDAREGEFAYVERMFSRTGEFSFTGADRIRDRGDVAYLFRSLEDYSVENVFAVLVKDGRARVLHIGMGHATSSVADLGAIRAGVDAFGADKIYLVHNHPSGTMRASEPDRRLMRTLEEAFEDRIETEGIIIDTTSGRFVTFDGTGKASVLDRPRGLDSGKAAEAASRNRNAGKDVRTMETAAEVLRFDHADRSAMPETVTAVRGSGDVSDFLKKLRFGDGTKISYLILSNNNEIIGNFHTDYSGVGDMGLGEEIASVAAKFGGTRVIVYGNMPLDGVNSLGDEIQTRSLKSIRLLDMMGMRNGIGRSALDSGVLTVSYAGEPYGNAVGEPMVTGRRRDGLRLPPQHGQESFGAMRERAVRERGIVMPGLNEAEVRVVDVPRHYFSGTGRQAIEKARDWANSHLIGKHEYHENQDDGFTYEIDVDAIGKYLSSSSTKGSQNLGVHLAVLKKLPEVIDSSIEVEIHADYAKANGKRTAENGVQNPDILVHRYYGAANVDGTPYRVKTTIKETSKGGISPYNYQVTELELLISGSEASDALSNSNRIDAAKLLKGVEKSYDPGKKLLDESGKRAEREPEYRTAEESAERRPMRRPSAEEGMAWPLRSPEGRLISANAHDHARNAMRIVERRRQELLEARGSSDREGQREIDRELDSLEFDMLYYDRMAHGEDVERTMPGRAEHQRMLSTARELASELGEKVVLYESPWDIHDSNPRRETRKRRSYGWHNPNDGTIHINVGRHRNAEEVVRTVLHEIIGHKTAEEILGPERFGHMIDEIWEHADKELRAKIAGKMNRNGWDYREAVRETFAEACEKMDEFGFDRLDRGEKTLLGRIKAKMENFFNRILRGLRIPGRVRLSFRDLSYMGYRMRESKRRMAAGKPAEGDIIDKAMDAARRERWERESDIEISARENGGDKTMAERAREVIEQPAIEIEPHSLTKEELKQVYAGLPSVEKDGREIEFYNSAFGKNYRPDGNFAKIVPQMSEILESARFAYSTRDQLGGQLRRDGTKHKSHPNFTGFDNYVGKVRIGEKEYFVRITVQNAGKGHQSGVHSSMVTNVELYENPAALNSLPIIHGGAVNYDRIVDAKLREFFESAKKDPENLSDYLRSEYNNADMEYRVRQKAAPRHTVKVYKLVRVKDGHPGEWYPLFIDSASPLKIGEWHDADSPDLDMLRGREPGQYLVNPQTKEVMTRSEFNELHPELRTLHRGKDTKYPGVEAIDYATDNGLRWMEIEETDKAQRRFDGENRRYWNLGINGSGSVSTFSMRPGWHAGSLPTMRQIGKGKNKDLRDDNFVWVEGEVSADVDYQAEAERNPDKDLPDRIPEDGFYMKATNANKSTSQADRVGWYVAGSFKANRFLSDAEARQIVDDFNAAHPDMKPVEHDYPRESGRTYDPEGGLHFRDGDDMAEMSIGDRTLRLSLMLADRHEADVTVRDAAVEALGKKLGDIRKAMSAQNTYDFDTVRSLRVVADMLMRSGGFLPEGKAEVKRLTSILNRGIGHEYTTKDGEKRVVQSEKDFKAAADDLMDLFVENQLKLSGRFLEDVMKIRGSKVNSRGVEVMGKLDTEGQITVKALKDYMNLNDPQAIQDRIENLDEIIANGNKTASMNAAAEKIGVELARQYVEEVTYRKAQERAMEDQLRDMKQTWDASKSKEERQAYTEQRQAIREAIRKTRIERADAMRQLGSQIGNELRNSVERVKEFREREKERIQEIWHNANSDMKGRPHYETGMKKGIGAKLSNNIISRILLAPTATFEQMMRMFGSKSIDGEGYLFDRFVTGWQECRDREWASTQQTEEMLNRKATAVLGKKHGRWSDLYSLTTKRAGTVKWLDGGEMREHDVTQGNLMYMYMVNKMTDGRIKLRGMGITEEKMAEIEQALDPKLKETADWLQQELLPALRDKYNEVHVRMFGAPMAEIENYFPLRILSNARVEQVEMAGQIDGKDLPKTMTGAIIKRRFNNYALDILNSDAVSVALDHIREMETWSAFAEYRRDLCTLLSYKHFRNQVKNMTTIYGSGDRLWNKFYNLSLLVGGAYRPKNNEFDKAAVNITKLATGACIAIRINTALKQLLSHPAFAPEANLARLTYNLAAPWQARKCWKWAMENMPSFQRRWISRQAGNDILRDWEGDWDWTRSDFVQKIQRAGITPNAFIDALTVATGSEAVYHNKLMEYIKDGFSKEEAHRRAVMDAEITFNLSQQSSELPYLSLLQNDRSYLTTCITNFRNSPMSYLRQSIQSKRELYNMIRNKDEQIEFETKKGVREGLTPEQAKARAKRKYRHNWTRNLFKSMTFDFILPALWTFGLTGAWYCIFGDDKEKKKQYATDSLKRGVLGGLEGFTGGGTMPDLIYGLVMGENPHFDEESSPAMGLISDMINDFSNGKTELAASEMINTMVALGVGVNPQVMEDGVVAGMDFFGQDEKSARDWALLFMRVIQCPQSQMDQVYFDELGMNAREAQRMSPAQLAERYATYKVRRNNFATLWAMNDSQMETAKEPWRKRFETEAKERLKGQSESGINERLERYDNEWSATRKRLTDVRQKPAGVIDKAHESRKILENPEGERYKLYVRLHSGLDKMIRSWLDAPTPEAAAKEANAILDYKSKVVEMLDNWDNPSKSRSAQRDARKIVHDWRLRHREQAEESAVNQ